MLPMRFVKTWERRSRSPGTTEGHGGCVPVGADEPDGGAWVECLQVEDGVVGEFDQVYVGDVEWAAFVEAGEVRRSSTRFACGRTLS